MVVAEPPVLIDVFDVGTVVRVVAAVEVELLAPVVGLAVVEDETLEETVAEAEAEEEDEEAPDPVPLPSHLPHLSGFRRLKSDLEEYSMAPLNLDQLTVQACHF